MNIKKFCMELLLYTNTFDNSIKTCFLNKKYTVLLQTHPTQIETITFLIENPGLIGVAKVIGLQKLC